MATGLDDGSLLLLKHLLLLTLDILLLTFLVDLLLSRQFFCKVVRYMFKNRPNFFLI